MDELAQEQHKQECLHRYYKNMELSKARAIRANMSKRNKALFDAKINKIKGYPFI